MLELIGALHWAQISFYLLGLIILIILGIRAYNKKQSETFEDRDN